MKPSSTEPDAAAGVAGAGSAGAGPDPTAGPGDAAGPGNPTASGTPTASGNPGDTADIAATASPADGTDAATSAARGPATLAVIPRQRVPEPPASPLSAPAWSAPAATVRPVSFDRPLYQGGTDLGWADPAVERRIQDASRRAREQAHALGYAAGWAEGRKAAAAQEEVERAERAVAAAESLRDQRIRIQALLETLGQAAHRVAQASVPAWNQVADAVADGALAIARAALGRELSAVDAEAADGVRAALRTLATVESVTVHVSPRDLDLLRRLIGEELPEHVHLAADPAVPPGAVLAATPVQRLHRDLPAAVARAEEVLRS